MKTYETSATVEPRGQVHIDGVPFAPGTQVEVIIHPIEPGDESSNGSNGASRTASLLTALDKAHNVEPLGSIKRDELYDRGVLH